MTLSLKSEPTPLTLSPDGVVQVGGTRVSLDTVMAAFKQGATPEAIIQRYPSLKLGDVYASLAFYFNHQAEVETYLQQRQQQAHEVRHVNEARFNPQALRVRLRERRAAQ